MKILTHILAALVGLVLGLAGIVAWDVYEERKRRHYFKV